MSKISNSLSVEENNDAELAFDLFKDQPDQYCLPRENLQKALIFFLSLYEPISKELREEKLDSISKAYASLLNYSFFLSTIKQIKTSNRGITKKEATKLNNNYIMKHLSEKNIIHIDKCWGKFDKKKLGFLLYQDIRGCVDLILSSYNTRHVGYKPYSNNEELQTQSSPVMKGYDQATCDQIIDDNKIRSKSDTQKGEFQLQQEKQLSVIESKVHIEQKNGIDEWIISLEHEGSVSFERFANYISQLIVENNLKFKSLQTECQCNIF